MRRSYFPVFLCISLFALLAGACNKTDNYTKSASYANVVYKIQSSEPGLYVTYSVGVYTDSIKGNIDYDTTFAATGNFNIPSTVLVGTNVTLFAMSDSGDNFAIQITDENGSIIKQSDTITLDPANALHADRYFAKLVYQP